MRTLFCLFVRQIAIASCLPVKQALGHAGLPWEGPELKDLDRQRCGILIGSAMGGMGTFAAGEEALVTSGARTTLACFQYPALPLAESCQKGVKHGGEGGLTLRR